MDKSFEEKVFDELKLINLSISDLQHKTDVMQDSISDLQHKTDVIRDSVVLLEQKVATELPTLFDGYSMEHDIQGIHQNAINSLNKKVDNHDIRISILEQKAL